MITDVQRYHLRKKINIKQTRLQMILKIVGENSNFVCTNHANFNYLLILG